MKRASAAIIFGLLSGMMAASGRAQPPASITIHGRVVDDGSVIRFEAVA